MLCSINFSLKFQPKIPLPTRLSQTPCTVRMRKKKTVKQKVASRERVLPGARKHGTAAENGTAPSFLSAYEGISHGHVNEALYA